MRKGNDGKGLPEAMKRTADYDDNVAPRPIARNDDGDDNDIAVAEPIETKEDEDDAVLADAKTSEGDDDEGFVAAARMRKEGTEKGEELWREEMDLYTYWEAKISRRRLPPPRFFSLSGVEGVISSIRELITQLALFSSLHLQYLCTAMNRSHQLLVKMLVQSVGAVLDVITTSGSLYVKRGIR